MADQRLGIDPPQLLLSDGERDHRDVGGLESLVAQLLVEGHVGVAVDGRNHRRVSGGAEGFDLRNDGLVVAVAERRVRLHDVALRDVLRLEEGPEDLVGGAGIDVVGAEQEEARRAAALLGHQILDRGDRLLIRRRARVEDVLRELLALVLDGIEEEPVQLLEDRQHGLAGNRRPAAEDHRHLVLGEELACLLREQRPVRGRIHHHRLELLPQHAALGVDLRDGHQRRVLEGRLADRHRSRQRMEDADLDGLRGARRRRAEQSGAEDRRQHECELPGVHGFGSPRPGRTWARPVQLRDHLARRGDASVSFERAAAGPDGARRKRRMHGSAPTKTSRTLPGKLRVGAAATVHGRAIGWSGCRRFRAFRGGERRIRRVRPSRGCQRLPNPGASMRLICSGLRIPWRAIQASAAATLAPPASPPDNSPWRRRAIAA